MSLFKAAIDEWGLPSRVRCDQGGENTEVAQYTLCPDEEKDELQLLLVKVSIIKEWNDFGGMFIRKFLGCTVIYSATWKNSVGLVQV